MQGQDPRWLGGHRLVQVSLIDLASANPEEAADLCSMYVKSVAVLAQVVCIVSFGPLADSRKLTLTDPCREEGKAEHLKRTGARESCSLPPTLVHSSAQQSSSFPRRHTRSHRS